MPLRDVQSGTSIILELPPHLPTPNRGGGGGGVGGQDSRPSPQPTEIRGILIFVFGQCVIQG